LRIAAGGHRPTGRGNALAASLGRRDSGTLLVDRAATRRFAFAVGLAIAPRARDRGRAWLGLQGDDANPGSDAYELVGDAAGGRWLSQPAQAFMVPVRR
jgi:hypothetical protein